MPKAKRRKFSCDFETTTDPNDCRVWAFGCVEIGNTKNMIVGNNMDDFMTWARRTQGDLYFHNLKFDGEYIVNYLLHNGFKYEPNGGADTFDVTISNMGQWYKIDICYGFKTNTKRREKQHTVIYDSLKKLPFTVKSIAEGFKLDMKKGEIDYKAYRPVGHEITAEELEYLENDVLIIAEALEKQFSKGLTQMTIGADALNEYKNVISKKMFSKLFPVFDLKLNREFREAYKGGFTWLNKIHAEKDMGEGIVFDVNSLYPSVMYNKPLPYGEPLPFKGEYKYDENYPLYVQQIKCEFELKEGYIPTIQIKRDARFAANEYLEHSNGHRVDLYVSSVDLELMKEHYYLDEVEFIGGYKFKQRTGLFNDYIDKWTAVKTSPDSTAAEVILAKLMLNSLYGKFGTNPNVTGKIPKLNPNTGACQFVAAPEDFKDPVYTPMGIFITSWARHVTITTAQKCFDRIIYCDTDSIHLTGGDIPEAIKDIVHPKELGKWAYEGTFKRARYLRQKTYIQEIYGYEIETEEGKIFKACEPEKATSTKTSVKCAGMPDNVKKRVGFHNFYVGLTLEGKLMPHHVKGGVVLLDTNFTIK